MNVETLVCHDCGQTTPLEQCRKNTKNKIGRDPICKRCDSARAKSWNDAHPEQRRAHYPRQIARQSKRYRNDPEFRESYLRRQREYRRNRYQTDPAFRERAKESMRRYNLRRSQAAA